MELIDGGARHGLGVSKPCYCGWLRSPAPPTGGLKAYKSWDVDHLSTGDFATIHNILDICLSSLIIFLNKSIHSSSIFQTVDVSRIQQNHLKCFRLSHCRVTATLSADLVLSHPSSRSTDILAGKMGYGMMVIPKKCHEFI